MTVRAVTRNSGAGSDSIVTMARNVARATVRPKWDSKSLSTKNTRWPPQKCPQRIVGAALKDTLRANNSHGESMRCVVRCGSAIAAPVPCRAVKTVHHDSPSELRLKIDCPHAGLTLRAARSSILRGFHNRRFLIARRLVSSSSGDNGARQLTALGDVTLAMRIAVTTEPPRLRVAFRKNMQAPAPYEFRSRETNGNRLFAATGPVADSCLKRHKAVFV